MPGSLATGRPPSSLLAGGDMSHYGGAVAVAESLGSAGQELTHQLRDPQLSPVAGELLVISVFNGIGGALVEAATEHLMHLRAGKRQPRRPLKTEGSGLSAWSKLPRSI